MSLTAMRDQIKLILQGVTGIGVVYDYERVAVEPGEARETFGTGIAKSINAWMVSRSRSVERLLTSHEVLRIHTFAIQGLFEHNDQTGSEKAFQDLIESVVAAFRGNETLNGTAELAQPVMVREVRHRLIGGAILVHWAVLELEAQERISL